MKNIKLYELSKIEHLGQMKKIIDDGFDINAIIRGYTALSCRIRTPSHDEALS